MKNKKLLISIGIVVVLAIVTFGIYRSRQQTTDSNVIRIGAILPLTGVYGAVGENTLQGIKLALDDVKQIYPALQINLLIEDGKGEIKSSINSFNKLMTKEIEAIIAMGTYQVEAVAPLAAQVHLPMIALGDPNAQFLDCNSEQTWVFSTFLSTMLAGQKIAEYAIKENYKRIAILYLNAQLGMETTNAFIEVYERLGGTVVAKEVFEENSLNFRESIAKVIGQNTDAFCIFGYGPGYCNVINQVREAGFNGIILTNDAVVGRDSQSILKRLDNIVYTFPEVPTSSEYQQVKNRFETLYGKNIDIFAAYGYDSVMILAKSMIEAREKHLPTNQILLGFKNVKILMGEISFLANGDCIVPIQLLKLESDKK